MHRLISKHIRSGIQQAESPLMKPPAKPTPQSKGGRARADRLDAEKRSAIARQGAEKRWRKRGAAPLGENGMPYATYMGDRDVGGLLIPVFNLKDGRRVVSERGFLAMIGAKGRGASGGHRIGAILRDSLVKSFFSQDLLVAIENPIWFLNLTDTPTRGYSSEIFKDFCIAFSKAKEAGVLVTDAQKRYGESCQRLLYAFAQAGIDSWIDEATGFQADRARNAIDEILKRYIAPSYFGWSKTFPDEFFEQIYKLQGWDYDPHTTARPGHVGRVIADVVYSRLAPGVLDELEKRNPVLPETKRRKKKHHQWLTKDHGHPKLREHIGNLIFMMRGHTKWAGFYRNLQRAAPRTHETPEFDFGDE